MMLRLNNKILITALLSLLTLQFNIHKAFGVAGTNSAEFLLIGVGARPTGMGEAFTAVADDVNTISYNPAGLSQIEDTQVTFMHSEWIDDMAYEYLGLAHHFEKLGTFGLEVRYLHMGELEGRSVNGTETSNFNSSSWAGTLSYGKSVIDNLAVGTNLKVLQENIEYEQATGFAFDFGGLYGIELDDNLLQFGVSAQNIGPEIKFVSEEESLPVNIKFGTAYKISRNNNLLTLAFDVNLPEESDRYFNIGAEYCFKKIVTARIGYKAEQELETSSRLNLGFGVGTKKYGVDYTYVPFEDLGQTHRVSLFACFGKDSSKKQPKASENHKKKYVFIDNIDKTIVEILDKIESNNKEESVVRLSENFIYHEDITIYIGNKMDSVIEKLADIMLIMPEYKIEIVRYSNKLKTYFLNKGIDANRIIYSGKPILEKASTPKGYSNVVMSD
jgi:hypothetical protein